MLPSRSAVRVRRQAAGRSVGRLRTPDRAKYSRSPARLIGQLPADGVMTDVEPRAAMGHPTAAATFSGEAVEQTNERKNVSVRVCVWPRGARGFVTVRERRFPRVGRFVSRPISSLSLALICLAWRLLR